jgi:hypothetical protein
MTTWSWDVSPVWWFGTTWRYILRPNHLFLDKSVDKQAYMWTFPRPNKSPLSVWPTSPRHKKPAPRSSAGRALRRHIVAQAALPRLGGVVVNGGQRSTVSICVSVHKSNRHAGVAREVCSRRREHTRWKNGSAAGRGDVVRVGPRFALLSDFKAQVLDRSAHRWAAFSSDADGLPSCVLSCATKSQ